MALPRPALIDSPRKFVATALRRTQVLAPAVSALPVRASALDAVLALELAVQPEWATALVRADAAAGCLLFQGPGGLARAALKVVNGVAFEADGSGPDWEALLRLLGYVRDALLGPRSRMPGEVREKWESKLAGAEAAVRAARLLARLGFSVPPMVIQTSDSAGLLVLLRETLTAAAAGIKVRCAAEEEWEIGEGEAEAYARLWRDARDLHAFGFGRAMPLAKVLEEFVRAALLAQSWGVAERCGTDTLCTSQLLARYHTRPAHKRRRGQCRYVALRWRARLTSPSTRHKQFCCWKCKYLIRKRANL
jgi:hypothetical protein